MPLFYQAAGILIGAAAMLFIAAQAAASGLTDQAELLESVMLEYKRQAMLITMLAAIITIPLCLWLFTKDEKERKLLNGEKQHKKASALSWVMLVLLAVSSCIGLNYWISLSGLMDLFSGFHEVAEMLYGGSFFVQILAIGVAAPVVEELLFRGLAYKRLSDYMGKRVAALLSAIFFGVYHMNLVQGLYAFLIGILLVYVYEKYHTLLAPVIFHMAANLVSVGITAMVTERIIEETWKFMLVAATGMTMIGVGTLFYMSKMKLTEEVS